jgi:hypothetical protein
VAKGEAGLDQPALDRAPGEPRAGGLAHPSGSALGSAAARVDGVAKPRALLAIQLDSSRSIYELLLLK